MTMIVTKSPKANQIRTVRYLPENLELEPKQTERLSIGKEIQLVLANLMGQSPQGGRTIDAFEWAALKVSAYGSGYTLYSIKTGTAPVAYNTTDILSVTSGKIHRWDILIETQEALVSFYDDSAKVWMGSIPLTVGYHSIEFSSSSCRISKRGAIAGTYTLIGWL